MAKARGLKYTKHAECMKGDENAYKLLAPKSEENGPLGRT
jgi:hypothetical protein